MNKVLTLLIVVILSVETLIMLLLPVVLKAWVAPWVPALIDSICVSLAAIISLFWMNKRGWINFNPAGSQGRGGLGFAGLKTGAIVFTVEAILMFALEIPASVLNQWQLTLLDVVALSTITPIIIYWLVLKPLRDDSTYQPAPPKNYYTLANGVLGYVGAVLLLALVLLSVHKQQILRQQLKLENSEAQELALVKSAFLNRLQQASLDVLALSLESDLHELIEFQSQHALFELESDYVNLARIKTGFDQIRYIDKNGDEIIRINQQDGKPTTVGRHQLQNKFSRYYFKNGMSLNKGQIYLSPFDLNIEHEQVDIPYKPIIRVVTVVTNSAGEKTGIIVINLKGKPILNDMSRASNTMSGHISLLNKEGYWLHGAEPEKLWGFMFPDKQAQRFSLQKVDVWKEFQKQQRGTVHTTEGAYIFETIEFDLNRLFDTDSDKVTQFVNIQDMPSWKLISYIPDTLTESSLNRERRLLIFLFLLISCFGSAGVFVLVRALQNRNIAEFKLFHLAHFDNLTRLANRSLFAENLKREMALARRLQKPAVLMYMDLDHFKAINDELGHEAGDDVLIQVSDRLRNCVRESDTLARLGGDEFAAILPQADNPQDTALVAQRIIEQIQQPFQLGEHKRKLGISIGIAVSIEGDKPADLIRRADKAMYEAKQAGRSCYQFASE